MADDYLRGSGYCCNAATRCGRSRTAPTPGLSAWPRPEPRSPLATCWTSKRSARRTRRRDRRLLLQPDRARTAGGDRALRAGRRRRHQPCGTTSLDRRATAGPHAHADHAPAAHVLRRVARLVLGDRRHQRRHDCPWAPGGTPPSPVRIRPTSSPPCWRIRNRTTARSVLWSGPGRDEQDDIAEAIGRTLGCEYPDELYASEIADLVTQFLGCRVDRHTQQLQRVAAFPYRLCSRDAEHAKGFHSTVFGLRDDGAALVAWRIRC